MENVKLKIEKGCFWKVTTFVFLLTTLSGCSENKPIPKKEPIKDFGAELRKMEAIHEHRKPLPDSLENGAHSLTGAIQYLEGHNSIHACKIGESGARSKVFDAYRILKREAGNDHLFGLLKSETPAARVYAYVALVQRDSTLRNKAWSQLRGKTDVVYLQSGCSDYYSPVDQLCVDPPEFVRNPVEVEEVLVQ